MGCLDPLLGLGLRTLLAGSAEVIGSAALAGERVLTQHSADLLVVDQSVEHAFLRHLRETDHGTNVLVLADEPSLTLGMRLLANGAACIARGLPVADVLSAVQLVARGERLFAPANGQWIYRRYPLHAPPLTPRELEVLRHLSGGTSHAATGLALGIGERTVQTHAKSICRKFEVTGTKELIGIPIPDRPDLAG